MPFVESQFLFYFLPAALVLHRILIALTPGNRYGAPARLGIFLLTLYFYGKNEPWWLLPFGVCIVFDFTWATLLARTQSNRWRKIWLAASVSQNLGLLAVFKYWAFLTENLGLPGWAQAVQVSLPPGISFYTFESLSFVIDIYYRRVSPPKSPLEFFAFIGMFPRFIAGPIVRYRDMVGQFSQYRGMLWEEGLNTFALGFLLKRFLADGAAAFVPLAFAATPGNWIGSWVGVLAYSVQIYFDFFGYSLMAIGLGKFLGFHFPENFRNPYQASSVQEFWQRWHISLSTWLRDYLYIPLGGSRGGRWKTYRNLMLTMLLGGLWHGANWTFVIWGGLHGLALCLERAIDRGLGRFGTLLVVVVAWVFFRADNAASALVVLRSLVPEGTADPRSILSLISLHSWESFGFASAILFLVLGEPQRIALPLRRRLLWGAIVLAALVPLGADEKRIPFLYFQF